jgi:hypothetical protein
MFKIQEVNAYDPQQVKALQKLVKDGEHQLLEFKKKVSHPEKIAEEIVGMANAKGGILLIGIDDNGLISGVKHAEGESHALKKALMNCKPIIPFTETFINISENKQVIKYAIPESNVKPHSIKTNSGWRTFIRVNDQCLQASKELTEVLKRSKKKSGFQFTYGDQEKLLMQYLEVHQFITLIECANLLKINKWRASRKLILLVLADVLKIEPSEKGDRYVRVFQ